MDEAAERSVHREGSLEQVERSDATSADAQNCTEWAVRQDTHPEAETTKDQVVMAGQVHGNAGGVPSKVSATAALRTEKRARLSRPVSLEPGEPGEPGPAGVQKFVGRDDPGSA